MLVNLCQPSTVTHPSSLTQSLTPSSLTRSLTPSSLSEPFPRLWDTLIRWVWSGGGVWQMQCGVQESEEILHFFIAVL